MGRAAMLANMDSYYSAACGRIAAHTDAILNMQFIP